VSCSCSIRGGSELPALAIGGDRLSALAERTLPDRLRVQSRSSFYPDTTRCQSNDM
jgi:hypothetical protein